MPKKSIIISNADIQTILGPQDKNLVLIEKSFPKVTFGLRGGKMNLKGSLNDLGIISKVIKELEIIIMKNGNLSKRDIETVIDCFTETGTKIEDQVSRILENKIAVITNTGVVKARTSTQNEYLKSIWNNDCVFAIGPAGTGKTYLAVAAAVALLKEHRISKIVLTRPAVEAGESLGFLPGDMREKIDPYLRPLYDALEEMITRDKLISLMDENIIEVIPLAYMRGRTLNNALIILDEAQNATSMQMKMFLTRLGIGSKTVITGDITQIDLESDHISGLVQIQKILRKVEGVKFIYFTSEDVIRHKLVKDIINAYNKFVKKKKE
ncbi:MAG: PhoH family protein [Bacteroidetes bacterium]|nr:PhoH family protein [Bacteroidota bacterium]